VKFAKISLRAAMAGVLMLVGVAATQFGNGAFAQAAATVQSGQSNLGEVLTGPDGRTLYVFTKDAPGVSNCTGSCLQNWPPLTVTAGTTPTATAALGLTLGTIVRADTGVTQVTLDGKPLYHWAADQSAGQTGGQGVGGVWFALDKTGRAVPLAAASPTAGGGTPAAPSTGTGPARNGGFAYDQVGFALVCASLALGGVTLAAKRRH
jgi:predicted lipoprotein with Yx(FWY)xxD motif